MLPFILALMGGRPATCRNYYVHPVVLDSYMDGTLLPAMTRSKEHTSHSEAGLRREELCVMAVIEKRQQTAKHLDFLSGAA
jgi:DNA topoisomerase-1